MTRGQCSQHVLLDCFKLFNRHCKKGEQQATQLWGAIIVCAYLKLLSFLNLRHPNEVQSAKLKKPVQPSVRQRDALGLQKQ